MSMSSDRRDDDPPLSSTESFLSNISPPADTLPTGISILFFHRGGVEKAQLAPEHSLIVGRHAPSDVRIPDSKVSGQHARFTFREGQVLVEDLGSHNGTWLDRTRITTAPVPLNGEVMLATVIARVVAPGPRVLAAVDSEEEFGKALDLELSRARDRRRGFAVLALRAPETEVAQGKAGSWAAQIRANLRPFERVRLHGANTALILLPEMTEDGAMAMARSLASSAGGSRRVGVATYPGDAASAHKLLDEARDALARTTPERPVLSVSGSRRTGGDVRSDDSPIIGAAQAKLFEQAKLVAPSRIPVLIQGESGTGKEVLARFVHQHGPRRNKPFIAVNCGLWTETLLESRLFGHEKGAFTGAVQMTKGVFEQADGGTLFLDEIGELKLEAQAALLRVLEAWTITRVGSTQEIKVDVRIVAATNRELPKMVAEGRFREDLYYRLHTMLLVVPPLRERRDEIAPLCARFVERANAEHRPSAWSGMLPVRGVAPEAMALLREHPWPGNVRELRNAIDRAVALAQGEWISPADLPEAVQAVHPQTAALSGGSSDPATTAPIERGPDRPGLRAGLLQRAAEAIEAAIHAAGGNLAEAAKALGVSERTLRRRRAKTLGRPKKKR